jgi:hypothetical protein
MCFFYSAKTREKIIYHPHSSVITAVKLGYSEQIIRSGLVGLWICHLENGSLPPKEEFTNEFHKNIYPFTPFDWLE